MDLFIDIGSTFIKYRYGKGEENQIPFPEAYLQENNKFEVKVDDILACLNLTFGNRHFNNVYISTQMTGYILFNKGQRVSEYISWRDRRGSHIKDIDLLGGVKWKPNLPILSIQTQYIEFDEYMTLGSFLMYHFTGKNISHINDLFASGFYSWDGKDEVVKTKLTLPKVCYDFKIIASVDGTNYYVPVGDQMAAVKAAANKDNIENSYFLNMGTASQLAAIINGCVTGVFESRPFFDRSSLASVCNLPDPKKYWNIENGKEQLAEIYKDALKKLPQRNRVILTGGNAKPNAPFLKEVFKLLDLECLYSPATPIAGIDKLISENKD